MHKTLTIAVHTDGTAEYTRNSEFTPFGGEGVMERVTDIQKYRHGNLFYIRWMLGPYADLAHCVSMAHDYGVPVPHRPQHDPAISEVITFPTYEAAVEHEVAMLNAMRKKGVRFGAAE